MPTATAPAASLIRCGRSLTVGIGGRIGHLHTVPVVSAVAPIPGLNGGYKKCAFPANVGVKSRISKLEYLSTGVSKSLHCAPPESSSCLQVSNAETSIEAEKDQEENEGTVSIKGLANLLDIRVGRILKAWRHEDAESLYVEEVDVGEGEPRIICSGLAKYIPLAELEGRNVVVLANLKPRNMRGVKSNGMLMAASDASHQTVELLEPPLDSVPGERVWFGGPSDRLNQSSPATPNQLQKKKVWESVQPYLKTDGSCNCILGEHYMQTSAGIVACKSLSNANVS